MRTITKSVVERPAVDVIVAGSGPAGIAAAVKAAREGAKVLLIEQAGTVGGVSTSGMMSHFTGLANSKLYFETLDRQRKFDGRSDKVELITIDPEVLINVYYDMLSEVGAQIRLFTFVSDVVKDGRTIEGVITESKSGTEYIPAKVFIDCTGDGDLAARAGAEYFSGRETDGKMQPATLMFKVAGVDEARAIFPGSFETTVETAKGEIQALARKHLQSPCGHVLLYRTSLPGVVTVNMTNCLDVDGTDAADLTKAEIVCRKQMFAIQAFLREFAPGYENCYVIGAASYVGIRETRHFIGEKTITETDIYQARQFDDWAVRGAYFNFDVHNISGSGLDRTGLQREFGQRNSYAIPYGCLVPKKLDNVLLAGRCISGTHLAHSNYRAMPICLALGEAAGAAAAIAVKKGLAVRDVPIGALHEALER